MNRLPTRVDVTVSRFGVHMRELIIVGVGTFLLILSVVVFSHAILIGIFVGFSALTLSVLYAFWRVGGVWPVEKYILHVFWYRSRRRQFIKDGATAAPAISRQRPMIQEPAASPASETAGTLFYLPEGLSPKSNRDLVFKLVVMWAVFLLVVVMSLALRDTPTWLNTWRWRP